METTLGSAAERRQNGADRPFPELCLAHWYARLPEMKTPGLEGKEWPGAGQECAFEGVVAFFRKPGQLPGRGWDGGGACRNDCHLETITPLHPLLEVLQN